MRLLSLQFFQKALCFLVADPVVAWPRTAGESRTAGQGALQIQDICHLIAVNPTMSLYPNQ